jgi:hypothetical protein
VYPFGGFLIQYSAVAAVVLVVGRSAAQISFGGDEEGTPPPDNSCSTPFQKVSIKRDLLTKKDYYANNWKRLSFAMCDLFNLVLDSIYKF